MATKGIGSKPRPSPRQSQALERGLRHTFADPGLLAVALTHASVRTTGIREHDNERLEFLGDRVLGLVVAEILCEAMPQATEGELARRFNRLVRREACAEVAASLDLGRYLVLSEGEAESGGRGKATILGDACEALLGAVFLDGGYPAARDVVRHLWAPLLRLEGRDRPDAKTALQEWAQGLGMTIPVYNLTDRAGPDHAPHFTAEVRVPGRAPAVGVGMSRRLAEQAAASTFLLRERIWQEEHDEPTT